MTSRREPIPVSGAVATLTRGLSPSEPLHEGEDWPVYMSHLDWSRKHRQEDVECLGLLRWDAQDAVVWSASCDHCDLRFGVPAIYVNPELRSVQLLAASHLPDRFLDRAVTPTAGNKAARDACAITITRWGDDEAPRPPMLCGEPGRGKTHLVVRLAQLLIEKHGVNLRFCTFDDLMSEAKLAMDRKGESSQAVFDLASQVPLLVLDDLGAGMGSDWSYSMLEGLVDRRYRRMLPIMGTTNVAPSEWRDRFGARAGSRLMELCAPVEVTGPDWRLR